MARIGYITIPFALYAVLAVILLITLPEVSVVNTTLPVNFGYGVSAHNVTDHDIVMMGESNFKWLRMDVGPNFSSTTEKANNSGMKILGILHLPEQGSSNLSSWRDQVRNVVIENNKTVKAWEVLNEPADIFPFENASEISVITYFDILKAAYQAIKSIDHNITVVGFGGIRIVDGDVLDQIWADDLIEMGALSYCDAISIHIYSTTTDTYSTKLNFEKALKSVQELAEGIPIWITETGQPSEMNQVGFINVVYPLFSKAGIVNVFWYEFRDWIAERGLYFGLLQNDFTPRPSYYVFEQRS